MGHDVLDIRGTPDEGMEDEQLWERAQREGRLMITTDKGFVRYRDLAHNGILIVRLRQPNRLKIHERVIQAINQFNTEEWKGLLVVMRDIVQSVSRARAGE